ncbi:MAG TPA: lysylphosphatidylglycerol synthase transmembrane domain-containing protein [Bryobacteraceae bacterium]|nr:lysylphosphatidylglycerol synthase transmembrane domain-containing protein [Bryobacteraceae bacterium]
MLGVLCLMLAIAAFVWRMQESGFRTEVFLQTLSGSRVELIAASALAVLLSYLVRVARWKAMMRPICPQSRFRRLLAATVVGFTSVVFFGRPGEFVRPWLIARSESVSVSSQMAIWVLERILDLLMVLVLFGFALTRAELGPSAGPTLRMVLASGGAVALGLGVACVLVLVLSAFSANLARKLVHKATGLLPADGLRERLRGMFDGFLDGMRATGSASLLTQLLLWTALEWAVILAAMHLAIQSYPPTAAFTVVDSMVFTGFVAFGSAVQLPGIGGGMQVAAILIGTELFGLPLESATALALLIWALTWLVVVPIGVVVAFAEGWKWGAMRHVSVPEETTAS